LPPGLACIVCMPVVLASTGSTSGNNNNTVQLYLYRSMVIWLITIKQHGNNITDSPLLASTS
jgi:hypothetical protein